MEDEIDPLETLFLRLEVYGKTSYELIRLKTLCKAVEIIANYASKASVFYAFVIFVFFVSAGFAIWAGELLGKLYYGFFSVALFYLLVAFILYFFIRSRIEKKVSNALISKIQNE